MLQEFRPGDEIPSSGVYGVKHHHHHDAADEVTCIKGRRFPPCNECSKSVTFFADRLAHHVDNRDEFRR